MFGSPSASTLGTHPTTWGTVDLNGDGVLDLVVFGLGVPHDPTQVRTPGFEVGSPHWLVYAGTPEGFDAVGQPWPIPTGGAVGAGFVGLSGSPGPLESATMGAEAWETIDLNGDGLLDLVVTAQASPHPTLPWGLEVLSHGTAPHWSVYLNTGSGFAATPLWWGVPWGGAFDSGFSTLQGSPGGHSYDAIGADGWTTADLDGDGIPELVRTATAVERPGFFWWPEVFGYPNDPHWLVHENTGDGFAPTASRWNLPPGGSALSGFFGFAGTPGRELAEGLGGHAWSVEDLDGDGALDLIVTAEAVLRPGFAWWPRVFDHDVAPAWRVHLGTRGGFDTDPLMWSLPAGGAHWSGFASASGVPGPAGSPEVQGADAWSLRDVTGDGAPDLVTTGRAVPRAGYAWWTQVLGHTQDLPQWSVYANTGAGFEVRGEPWRVPTRGDAFGGIAGLQGGPGIDAYETIGGHAWTTADVDGDARVDLIVMSRARARDGFFWWLETLGFADGSPHWDVYLGTP